MSFEDEGRPPRPAPSGRRWMVRLFETSDKLEEHLNRSNLRPDQVASISVDQDGFFVLVYCVGGGPPPDAERRPFRADAGEARPFQRRRFEEDESGGGGGGFREERPAFREERPFGRPPPRRDFDRGGGGGGGRDFPQRRPPRR